VRNAIKFSSYTYIKEVLVGKRAFATFVSPNLFASYLIMILFLGLGLWSENKRKKIYLMAVFLISLSLIYTKSIGAILTFIFVFSFWFYFFIRQDRFIPNKRTKLIAVFMVLFISIMVLIFLFINRHKISHFFDLSYTHNSIIQRLYYWRTALKMIKDYPLLGIGWRKFEIFYYFYKPSLANMSRYAHNVFLQITVELGIFGLLVFLSILYFFFKEAVRIIKDNPSVFLFRFSLFCSGISFLLHNLFDLSFYFGQVSFFWWLLLGLLNNFFLFKQAS
jgi:O-antigen ligase